MVEHFDIASYVGVVLDESSILEAAALKDPRQDHRLFQDTRHKLSCTATPSPMTIDLAIRHEFLGA